MTDVLRQGRFTDKPNDLVLWFANKRQVINKEKLMTVVLRWYQNYHLCEINIIIMYEVNSIITCNTKMHVWNGS